MLGELTSNTCTISTGTPQGCVISPLLFSLYTNDCTSKDPSVKLLKFADDTTVIGLIQDGDKSAYRQEVEQLAVWCSHNNLELNTLKTVEMIVDLRRNPPALPPLTAMNNTVDAVASFRFLVRCKQFVSMQSCLGADEACAPTEQEYFRLNGYVVVSPAVVMEGTLCLPSTQGTAHTTSHNYDITTGM